MAWLLATLTTVLALLVLALAVLVVRLQRRLAELEGRVAARTTHAEPRGPDRPADPRPGLPTASPQAPGPTREAEQYVITRIGEPEPAVPVPTVAAPVFADLVLRETVVQTAALVQGLRRALAPETRNRIRFHMRQEVKRSRKQRRAELRELRREWARRRAAGAGTADGTAA